MMKLRRISIVQTDKVAAFIWFILSLVLVIPTGLLSAFVLPTGNPFGSFGNAFFFIAPFVHTLTGFVMTAILCWLCHVTAGIQFEFEAAEGNQPVGTAISWPSAPFSG